jgi:glycosyltransferase involved in cell wall biosynthesis
MSCSPKVAFGCTILDKGLSGTGIDGIGHYCQELLGELSKRSDLQVAPFSFGIEHSNVGAKTLPAYPSHLARNLLKLESGVSETRQFFNNADIIHSTDQLIPLVANKPLIATVMDTIPLSNPEFIRASSRYLKTALWKNLTKRADHIITISEFSKDEIANFMSYPEEKITSIPLGVDLRYFEKLTKEQIQSVLNQLAIDRSFFLFIGSIQPRKNLVRLLQAHASLPKNYAREFPLVIAGKIAWDDGETVKAIQAAVTDKRCLWLNYVSDIEKRALLQATQGLIFASLYEGFGLPILEAFASGAPVITSNCTSMPEVAQDAGILVDPYKLDSIQAALLRLIEDGSLKQSLASKGRGVSKQFNWSKTAASTAEIYSLFA